MKPSKHLKLAIAFLILPVVIIALFIIYDAHNNTHPLLLTTEFNPTPGTIVIYVRTDCKTCKNLTREINQFYKQQHSIDTNIYIIDSRSPFGEELRETYPIDVVPAAVLIGKPDRPYVPLAVSDHTFNTEGMERLIQEAKALKGEVILW